MHSGTVVVPAGSKSRHALLLALGAAVGAHIELAHGAPACKCLFCLALLLTIQESAQARMAS
jgi:hypothetical protein